jgi:hypothetical protein
MDVIASIAARVRLESAVDVFLRGRVWHIKQPGDLALRKQLKRRRCVTV